VGHGGEGVRLLDHPVAGLPSVQTQVLPLFLLVAFIQVVFYSFSKF
jgi:hypothetical protein